MVIEAGGASPPRVTKTWLFSIVAIQSDFAMFITHPTIKAFVIALSSPCAVANGLLWVARYEKPLVFAPAFDINLRVTFPTLPRVFRRHYDSCWLESESESTFVSHHPAPHLFISSHLFF
ncbi:hypothetical protein BYT27DRAFT_7181368 [Phlegmacium glaucopus]|nr:hypothetical protein BYT27DRAFT_7181368 [Phlegmacium glaucopus]